MKKNIVIQIALLALLVLQACSSNTGSAEKSNESTSSFEIIGKSATIVLPQFKVEETFTSDTTLHWKTFNDAGVIGEEDEKIGYKKIGDSLFFLNWIEKTGLTVSQVLDFKKGTVVVYVSHADENSERGKRSANFLEGTAQLNK